MPLISGNVNFRLCSKSEKIVHSRTLIQQKGLSHFSQVVCEKETVALKYSFSSRCLCVYVHMANVGMDIALWPCLNIAIKKCDKI